VRKDRKDITETERRLVVPGRLVIRYCAIACSKLECRRCSGWMEKVTMPT
jgi:hypothetical protein